MAKKLYSANSALLASDRQKLLHQFEDLAISLGFSFDFKAEPDGVLHRVALAMDKPGRRSGWYVLFADGMLAGCIGNWITGESQSWHAKSSIAMTPMEIATFNARVAASKTAQQDKKRARHEHAARVAAELWKRAAPCVEHPYLTAKGVEAHDVRVLPWPQGFLDPDTGERDRTPVASLIVPLRDVGGKLWSLEAIAPDGRKDFLMGGRKRGCVHVIGMLVDTVCIAEGYATGASIYEATSYAVAVAFDCGNLLPVALELREKYPSVRIVVCADNDRFTTGNPGVTKATEAAKAVGGLLAIPSFEEGDDLE